MRSILILFSILNISAFGAVKPELGCNVFNYGQLDQGGEVLKGSFVFVPTIGGKSKSLEVGNLKATVRYYDPVGDGSRRLVVDLRGRLAEQNFPRKITQLSAYRGLQCGFAGLEVSPLASCRSFRG